MSKRIIQIEIDAKPQTCGECVFVAYNHMWKPKCSLFDVGLDRASDRDTERCQDCKAAEVKKP